MKEIVCEDRTIVRRAKAGLLWCVLTEGLANGVQCNVFLGKGGQWSMPGRDGSTIKCSQVHEEFKDKRMRAYRGGWITGGGNAAVA